MKRTLAGILLSSLFITGGALRAADAVALAAQQEAEERYKRLTATVEELQMAQTAQQKQISALASEVSKLRDEIARNNNNAATQESIRQLNEQIRKVDQSRIDDNKRVQEAFEKLGRTIKEMPAPPPSRRPSGGGDPGTGSGSSGTGTRPLNNGPSAVEDGFDYVIQSGDRLDLIVKAYRDKQIMVTSKAIKDANPNVDWSRLKIGQHIFIPKPK
jgi:TolA-binding protein